MPLPDPIGNPADKRPEAGAPLIPVQLQESAHKGFLGHVVGIGRTPAQSPEEPADRLLVAVNQQAECASIPGPRIRYQRCLAFIRHRSGDLGANSRMKKAPRAMTAMTSATIRKANA